MCLDKKQAWRPIALRPMTAFCSSMSILCIRGRIRHSFVFQSTVANIFIPSWMWKDLNWPKEQTELQGLEFQIIHFMFVMIIFVLFLCWEEFHGGCRALGVFGLLTSYYYVLRLHVLHELLLCMSITALCIRRRTRAILNAIETCDPDFIVWEMGVFRESHGLLLKNIHKYSLILPRLFVCFTYLMWDLYSRLIELRLFSPWVTCMRTTRTGMPTTISIFSFSSWSITRANVYDSYCAFPKCLQMNNVAHLYAERNITHGIALWYYSINTSQRGKSPSRLTPVSRSSNVAIWIYFDTSSPTT